MDPLLSQPEMDALRETINGGPTSPAPRPVRSLDLCADDRPLRRALAEIDEAAVASADALRISFTRALRGPVVVNPQHAEIIMVEDARLLEERTHGRLILVCDPGDCEVPLLIDAQLVFLHVQREFGGDLMPGLMGRMELTGLERAMLLKLAPTLTEALMRGFGSLGLKLRARAAPARAALTQGWGRQISVICLTWQITVGQTQGSVHLLLSPQVVEALHLRFGGERSGARDARWHNDQRALLAQLRLVDIEVVAELGRVQSSLTQVMAWEEGDIVRLDRSLTEHIPVLIDGRVRLRGRPGTRGDTVTLTIEQIGEMGES